ncbi:MAG: hypothetical protein P4L84_33355 [Isosphaeraceae bacterium]|nr:hypothetical protein [Isosphaeraceae bacterium]
MRFSRRRPHRPDSARYRLGSGLERLEARQVLNASFANGAFAPWVPNDLPVQNPITHEPVAVSAAGLINPNNAQSSGISNAGKILTGTDRQGDQWTITVHGPGEVIVTDATPQDGALDDNIDTIQLVGTSLTKTYVTGNVTASARTPTDGTVLFNKLIDNSGVRSVILNGFTLTQTVPPPNGGLNNTNTGVFLTGGVQYLQFHDILANIDQATDDQPINIEIGDPSTPLKVEPTIRLDSIFNTVFNSNASTVPTSPQTTGTVNIVVNGQIHGLNFISSTQAPTVDPAQALRLALTQRAINPTESPIVGAGEEVNFPIVGTTGRTSVQATAIDKLAVGGSAVNVTASRSATPFQNGLSGLKHLKVATFGGNADAVGLDVNGPIGSLTFKKGLGSPVGANTGGVTHPTSNQDATTAGTPVNQYGYPANFLLGGEITATRIRRLKIEAANVQRLSPTNPNYAQVNGEPVYVAEPGNATTNALITSSGSIGKTSIHGNTQNTQIVSGFDYTSYAAGLVGARAKSKIGPLHQKGSLIDSVTAATYRPANNEYGSAGDVAGPGTIVGRLKGRLYSTGTTLPLGNVTTANAGTGFFARRKKGELPPPQPSAASPATNY